MSTVIEEHATGFCSVDGSVDNDNDGFRGDGFANSENAVGRSIHWRISADYPSYVILEWRYANGSETNRRADVEVNGTAIDGVDFATTGAWTSWTTVSVNLPLAEGDNDIHLRALTSEGLANIDSLNLIGDGVSPTACQPIQPTNDCNAITGRPVITVARDGSGQFSSVQSAINTVSRTNSTPTLIRIKPGTYREKLLVDRPNITLCGQAGQQANTLLSYGDTADTPNGSGGTLGTYGSYSVAIDANDVSVENLTIENSHGPGIQAVALRTKGQRVQFRNCRLLGYQDTAYLHSGSQYFRDCLIQGTVDFIFGSATAVFDNATLYSIERGTALTAPSTDQNVPYGLVFLGGQATAAGSVRADSVALGRNWRPYGAATFIGMQLGNHISPVGWVAMGSNSLNTARFAEYGNSGPGADTSARAWQADQLSASEAARYTVDAILAPWHPSYSDN